MFQSATTLAGNCGQNCGNWTQRMICDPSKKHNRARMFLARLREPVVGFEPTTCCLRISWLMVYHYPLVSIAVEYSTIFISTDSTAMYVCV